MALTIKECLELSHGTFLRGETQHEGTVLLPPSVWGLKDDIDYKSLNKKGENMALTVKDCLELSHGTFLQGETRHDGTVLLPPCVWNLKDDYELEENCSWEEVTGWAYRWYDSGRWCMTENEYQGVFDTKKEAFEDARQYFECDDDEEDIRCWDNYYNEFVKEATDGHIVGT